jgi:hypothetical protein
VRFAAGIGDEEPSPVTGSMSLSQPSKKDFNECAYSYR